MSWQTSDLRKFLKWTLNIFEEDNGKSSEKRIIVIPLVWSLITLTIPHCSAAIDAHTITVTDACYLIGTHAGIILTLLGLNYIPTRKEEAK